LTSSAKLGERQAGDALGLNDLVLIDADFVEQGAEAKLCLPGNQVGSLSLALAPSAQGSRGRSWKG
jgi:hypothetical protein